jgi:hypothetical protein
MADTDEHQRKMFESFVEATEAYALDEHPQRAKSA